MPITLSQAASRTPVVRRKAIGEELVAALVRTEQRDQRDNKGNPKVRDDGKPRRELVVTLIVMPGTTMKVGIGDDVHDPQPGDVARLILKGKGFAEWIDATRGLATLQVGDVLTLSNTEAIVYNLDGSEVRRYKKQADVAKHRAEGLSGTVGVVGPLAIRRATAAEQQWVEAAEATYLAGENRPAVSPGYVDDEEPF